LAELIDGEFGGRTAVHVVGGCPAGGGHRGRTNPRRLPNEASEKRDSSSSRQNEPK
jgi:hypothetical protein